MVDVSPHMHYLGKSVEVTATLPDGSDRPLIRIDDWDFRWQGAYFYRRPVALPAGSRIDAYFRFDNSDENPFNPSARIAFSLPVRGRARMDIYSLRGRRVNTLIDAELSAGWHDLVWDGTDDAGRPLASGVYLYQLKTADALLSRKLTLLK